MVISFIEEKINYVVAKFTKRCDWDDSICKLNYMVHYRTIINNVEAHPNFILLLIFSK